MDERECRLALVQIRKLISSEKFEESLELIDNLLTEDLSDFVISEAYFQKAICLYNLKSFEDALTYLDKSFEIDEYFLDNKLYDEIFNEVHSTNFKRAYQLVSYKKYAESSDDKRAMRYYRLFLRNNQDLSMDEIDSYVGFKNPKSRLDDEKRMMRKELSYTISELMNLADESISDEDYDSAISYLNRLLDYGPALAKKADLLISKAMKKEVRTNEDYYAFWRNIGYLTEASKGNDEALLLKGFYFLDSGLLERALKCYDEFMVRHGKDKRGIF